MNTIVWSYPAVDADIPQNKLQVQSLVDRISSYGSSVDKDLIRLEIKLLLDIMEKYRNMPYFSINAVMDEWYASLPYSPGGRLLDVFRNGEGDLSIRFFRGEKKGEVFSPEDESYPGIGAAEGMIGKEARVLRVSKKSNTIFLEHGQREKALEITRFKDIDPKTLIENIRSSVPGEYADIVNQILSLIEQDPPEIFIFDDHIGDFMGYASRAHNMIACHDSVLREPVALFHEICEFLIREGYLHMKIRTKSGRITLNYGGEKKTINVREALEELSKEGEPWADKQAKYLNTDRSIHYLIRILQRQIFKDQDRNLTEMIRKEKNKKTRDNVLPDDNANDADKDRSGTKVLENASMEKGKLIGGEVVYSGTEINALNAFIKGKDNYAIRNFQLSERSGAFRFMGKTFWTSLKEYEGALVTVVVSGGKVKDVFDERGRQLYPFTDFLIYRDAEIINGKRIGGEQLSGAHSINGFKKNLKETPDCIAERVMLNSNGEFHHEGKAYWYDIREMENAPVTVKYLSGDPSEIYDETGRRLFPAYNDRPEDIRVYELINGTEKGELLLSTRNKNFAAGLLAKKDDLIVENWNLSKERGLKFNSKTLWYTMAGRASYEPVTLIVRNKEVEEVYGVNNELLYPIVETRVYVNSLIIDGKRTGGQLAGSARNISGIMKIIDEDLNGDDCVVEDLKLNSLGGCFFKGYLWTRMNGYENAKVTAEIKEGEAARVFDSSGREIYPFSGNLIYVGAKIVNGKRIGGELIEMSPGRRSLGSAHKKYPDAIIEKVSLDSRGGFLWDGRKYWKELKGYENREVTVEKTAGEVLAVYSVSGDLIYQDEDRVALRTFNELCEKGDMDRLIMLFGERSVTRILLRFFDHFTPEQIHMYIKDYKKTLPPWKKKKLYNGKKKRLKIEDVLDMVGSIEMFKVPRKEDALGILTEEIIKIVYTYLVNDHKFLLELERQIESENISDMVKDCYTRVLSYYGRNTDFCPGGISKNTRLKFYQKIGVRFIIEKERSILADEAGLGKTVQVLTAAVNAYEGKGAEKILILCPHISKVSVWQNQIKEHLRGEQPTMIIKDGKALDTEVKLRKAREARFIIVNYELLSGESGKDIRAKLKTLGIDFIVADEAHRIRNDTLVARAVSEFDARYKVLVSGTPFVGRNYAKLYNLLHWLYPERYRSLKEFKKMYCRSKGAINYAELRDGLKDIMLRRYFSDVMGEMPKLNIIVKPLIMEPRQSELYRELEKNIFEQENVPVLSQLHLLKRATVDTALLPDIRFVDQETGIVIRPEPGFPFIVLGGVECRITNGENGDIDIFYEGSKGAEKISYGRYERTFNLGIRRYRLAVENRRKDNPVLIFTDTKTRNSFKFQYGSKVVLDGVECAVKLHGDKDAEISYETPHEKVNILLKGKTRKSDVCVNGRTYLIENKRRRSFSSKFKALDEIVKDVLTVRKEKIVIFSGIVQAVTDMKKRYEKQGYNVYMIHGDVAHARRRKEIERFRQDTGPSIFISTYQTGGESIDLTCANNVVLTDQPWTIQEQYQLVRRVYRIKQKKDVNFFILQSLNSFDEAVAEVLMEGEMMENLILEDPGWIFKQREKLVQKYLKRKSNQRENDQNLKNFKKTHKKENILNQTMSISREVYGQKLIIASEGQTFFCRVRSKKGKVIDCESFKELLSVGGILDAQSKDMLRDFLSKKLEYDANAEINVKNMLMWMVFSELVPGFKDIDYHGRLEFIVEMSNFILSRIIVDPGITTVKLKEELGDIPENLYEETMYYLDRTNVLRAFSILNLIPPYYYYKGELLRYVHPIMAYYDNESIKYSDEQIIESIAPGIHIDPGEVSVRAEWFEKYAMLYREITREEEIRLARQLEYGNRAAEKILLYSKLKIIIPLAKRVKRKMYKVFGEKYAYSIDKKRLYSEGSEILGDLIRKYAQLGSYEYYSLDDYLQKRLNPRLYSKGYQMVKEMKDKSSSESFYQPGENGDVSLEDMETIDPVGSSRIEAKQTIDSMRRLMENMGFGSREIEFVTLFVFDGYSYSDMAEYWEEVYGETPEDEEYFADLIDRFRNKMSLIGKGTLEKIINDGISVGEQLIADDENFLDGKNIDSMIEGFSPNSRQIMDQIKMLYKKLSEKGELRPIDIVIDISLMHKDDLTENMETWAYLILMCGEMENIKFIFKRPDFFNDGSYPELLLTDLRNAPSEKDVMASLSSVLKSKNNNLSRESDIMKRINSGQREGAITVPIVSEVWLKWVRDLFQLRKVKLSEALSNVYPVSLEELTTIEGGVALRNFSAALSVGLTKAFLVMASGSEDNEGYIDLKRRLCVKINDIYTKLRKDISPGDITEEALDAMVSDKPFTRLNIAISLAIPKIMRKAINKIKEKHDLVQLYLQSA